MKTRKTKCRQSKVWYRFILSRCVHVLKLRTCLYPFFWRSSLENKSEIQINNSLHLARKYARIFVRGHYLFREANSFPRAKLEENCELRGTDNVQGQISEHIFKAKLRLLCLLSFKYFSQQAGSASPSYVNTSKFVNWLPKPRHSIFISRISNRLRFS